MQLPRLDALRDRCLHLLGAGEHPAVLESEVQFHLGGVVFLVIELVDLHVHGCELDDVPERVQDLPCVLGSFLERRVLLGVPLETGIVPGCVRPHRVQPHGVGTELRCDLLGLHHVAERFGHLLSLGVQHPRVHHDLVVGRPVE